MREIKFRAWDISHQDMEYINDFYQFEESGVHDSEGSGHYANYLLMQYTGLKDKNGKEIYEGDILSAVKYNTNIPTGSNHFEVFYNEDKLSFYWKNQNGYKEPFYDFNVTQVQYKIIGNIYENPELLITDEDIDNAIKEARKESKD